MRGVLLAGLVLAVLLAQACGGDADDGDATSTPVSTSGSTPGPTGAPAASPTSSTQAITFAQTYEVSYQVEREDGQWEIRLVPLASRVETYCADEPQWSARESGEGSWRVFAECQKLESVPADNPLVFEFLFYPEIGLVTPWNYPAHVAHSDYPWNP
ncbi:MAG: hypothetical protein GTO22_05365 [Gemmatimonadales bacterium]|nr:hypothetical protein [Gemmatimonadales bacterium]